MNRETLNPPGADTLGLLWQDVAEALARADCPPRHSRWIDYVLAVFDSPFFLARFDEA